MCDANAVCTSPATSVNLRLDAEASPQHKVRNNIRTAPDIADHSLPFDLLVLGLHWVKEHTDLPFEILESFLTSDPFQSAMSVTKVKSADEDCQNCEGPIAYLQSCPHGSQCTEKVTHAEAVNFVLVTFECTQKHVNSYLEGYPRPRKSLALTSFRLIASSRYYRL